MKNILSSVRLRAEMTEYLEEHFSDYEFRFIKAKEMTDEDRAWADIFITYGSDMKQEHMKAFKNLKWVMVMSAGLDDMPLEAMKDVHITNARGIHKIQMTEYTIGLLLAYFKDLYQLKRNQEERYWHPKALTEEIYDKTVHILGTGSIGCHLAGAFKALGLETGGYNTRGRDAENFDKTYPIDRLFDHVEAADILINVLPSTEHTRGLLTEGIFKEMKDESVFVNIGRGDVITDDTVRRVLDTAHIRHMILDVFNEEPLSEDHVFYSYDNLTITPHASSKTKAYLTRAFDIFIYNLERADDFDAMKNIIDHDRGY